MNDFIHDTIKRHRSQVDYMEIRVETETQFSFSFSEQELTQLDHTSDFGISIRACWHGGWGFVSLNSMEKLDQFARLVVEQARSLGGGKTQLAEVEPVRGTVPLHLKEDPRTIPIDDKLDLFRSYVDRCHVITPGLTRVKTAYFERFRTIHYVNTDGTDITQEKMDLAGMVMPCANKNNITQTRTVPCGSSNDFGVVRSLAPRLDAACQNVIALLDVPPVKGGKYTVILDPILAGIFAHEAFGHMSEADEYHQNPKMRKIFTLGRRFGNPILSIYDTGLDVGTRGYMRYDDEGVPTEKTYLIRHGELVGRMHSRESAAMFNEQPTGNARTIGYRHPPICRMRNTCIEQGSSSFEELLEGIKHGVYAVDSYGGSGGEMFSFEAGFGYMIRNGKLGEMVRDVQLSGNLFKTLARIDAVGNDFLIQDDTGGCGKNEQYPLETTCSAPHIRVSEMTVGGTL